MSEEGEAMKVALEWLNAEHRLISRVLASMGTFLSGLDPRDPESRRVLGQYVEFFRRYVEGRHEKIEESVFFTELLEQAGISEPIALLAEEHRQRVGRLATLAQLAGGKGPLKAAEMEQLADAAGAYSSQLRAHIAKEGHSLFPLAGLFLSEEHVQILAAHLMKYAAENEQTDLISVVERLIERHPPLS